VRRLSDPTALARFGALGRLVQCFLWFTRELRWFEERFIANHSCQTDKCAVFDLRMVRLSRKIWRPANRRAECNVRAMGWGTLLAVVVVTFVMGLAYAASQPPPAPELTDADVRAEVRKGNSLVAIRWYRILIESDSRAQERQWTGSPASHSGPCGICARALREGELAGQRNYN